MAEMPMFPLGSVLFPHMPLRLRVFEERYLLMLAGLLKTGGQASFGVVLIERGHEVGGGEHRFFGVGTVAEVLQLGSADGFVTLVARGAGRIEVVDWLEDDPHPRAQVRELAELTWDEDLAGLRSETEQRVRRTLALASEFSENLWPADVALADDPVAALWQLAAIAPVSSLDQVSLLRCTSAEELLRRTAELTEDAALSYDTPWPESEPDD